MTSYQKYILLTKLEELNTIPNINNGGCAIVALELYNFVKREFNIKSSIVYLLTTHSSRTISNIRSNLPDTCAHAMLRIDNLYYDTEGVYTKSELMDLCNNPKFVTVTLSYAHLSISRANTWNRTYDRRRNPTIKRILKDSQ